MNTFNIIENIKIIEEKVEKGDLTPEQVKDTLESLTIDRNERLNSVANWYEKNKSRIDWLDNTIKERQKQKRSLENLNKSLMEFMTTVIDSSGKKEIQTDDFILKTRKHTSYAVVIDNEEKLPQEYVTYETKINKLQIRKDLRENPDLELPGAHLEKKETKTTAIK